MPRRRRMTLLFVVRTTMAFQFASVGALGPLVRQTFGIGLPDLGLLIGLYLSPGLILAIPAGQRRAAMGTTRAAFDLGVVLLLLTCALYAVFIRLAERD